MATIPELIAKLRAKQANDLFLMSASEVRLLLDWNDELVAALKDARFAIEATETCLKTWNGGRGSPANVDGIIARLDSALARLTEAPKD